MTRRYIASIGLTAVTIFAAVTIATATYSHGLPADPTPHSARACSLDNSGHPTPDPARIGQSAVKASLPTTRLVAQLPLSNVCQTYAGPVCGMGVYIPVGSACTCYFHYPYGALPGYAR